MSHPATVSPNLPHRDKRMSRKTIAKSGFKSLWPLPEVARHLSLLIVKATDRTLCRTWRHRFVIQRHNFSGARIFRPKENRIMSGLLTFLFALVLCPALFAQTPAVAEPQLSQKLFSFTSLTPLTRRSGLRSSAMRRYRRGRPARSMREP